MSLTITNLQKKIDQRPVLEDVTFSLERGQVVGIQQCVVGVNFNQ